MRVALRNAQVSAIFDTERMAATKARAIWSRSAQPRSAHWSPGCCGRADLGRKAASSIEPESPDAPTSSRAGSASDNATTIAASADPVAGRQAGQPERRRDRRERKPHAERADGERHHQRAYGSAGFRRTECARCGSRGRSASATAATRRTSRSGTARDRRGAPNRPRQHAEGHVVEERRSGPMHTM